MGLLNFPRLGRIVFLLLLADCGYLLNSPAQANEPTTIFSEADLRGLQTISGNADPLQGKKQVLLYFWATWCTSCRQKLAHGDLDALGKAPSTAVLAVNTDKELGRVKSLLEKTPLLVPVVRDEKRVFLDAFQVSVLPAWAVLERSGDGKTWRRKASQVGGDTDTMRKTLGL